MEFICDNCSKKIRIPDQKVPKDRVAYLNCPSCKNRIPITRKKDLKTQKTPPKSSTNKKSDFSSLTLQELTSSAYDASEKPFDFIEEEAKTALICVQDPEARKIIGEALNASSFHHTTAEGARDALKQMRYHAFDAVVVDEKFDSRDIESNGVLIFLQHLPMSMRRNIFVALVSARFRTMDNMEAFHKSVNLIVNRRNLNDFHKVLTRAIAENDMFYRVFNKAQKKVMGA